jgi:hypothetical protein
MLFWWLMMALGHRILRQLRMPLSAFNVWERGLICGAVGIGLVQLIPLILSVFGRMRFLEIRLAFVILTILLYRDLLRIARRARVELSTIRPRHVTAMEMTWWLLFAAFMGIWLVHAVTFGTFGDDDGIHLAAPRRWLQAGTLRYLPTYSLTNATLGFDMAYLVAMALWSPVGAKMLHYTAGLFALFALVSCARRISSVAAGVLSVSLLLIATPVADLPVLFGNAMIDLAACWMAMMTVLIWLVWRERPEMNLLVLMALFAGVAASFKLTSAQVAIAWVPILIMEARRRRAPWPRVLQMITAFGFVAMACVLPWFLRNLLLTGNPLFPMFSNWIPTRDMPPEHALTFSRYTKYYAWGVASGTRLGEVERKQILMVAVGLLTTGGVTASLLVKNAVCRSLLAFATIFVLTSVILTGLIFRYWMPATMCVAIVGGVLCAQHWPRQLIRLASLFLVIALVIQARRGFYFHQPAGFMGDLRMATGVSTFEHEYADDSLAQVWRYINTSTPANSRILLAAFYTTFGASSYAGFWIDRVCYTTDSHLQAFFPLDDWASFTESLAREGITHVVVSDQQFSPGRLGFVFRAGQNEYPFARRLVQEYGDKVFQADHLQVYALRSFNRERQTMLLPRVHNVTFP